MPILLQWHAPLGLPWPLLPVSSEAVIRCSMWCKLSIQSHVGCCVFGAAGQVEERRSAAGILGQKNGPHPDRGRANEKRSKGNASTTHEQEVAARPSSTQAAACCCAPSLGRPWGRASKLQLGSGEGGYGAVLHRPQAGLGRGGHGGGSTAQEVVQLACGVGEGGRRGWAARHRKGYQACTTRRAAMRE